MIGDDRVHAHAKADGHGVDEILHRVDERERGHGVLTDLRDKEAVHDIIERVDQHGNDHGQRHGQQERQDLALLHKVFLH